VADYNTTALNFSECLHLKLGPTELCDSVYTEFTSISAEFTMDSVLCRIFKVGQIYAEFVNFIIFTTHRMRNLHHSTIIAFTYLRKSVLLFQAHLRDNNEKISFELKFSHFPSTFYFKTVKRYVNCRAF